MGLKNRIWAWIEKDLKLKERSASWWYNFMVSVLLCGIGFGLVALGLIFIILNIFPIATIFYRLIPIIGGAISIGIGFGFIYLGITQELGIKTEFN